MDTAIQFYNTWINPLLQYSNAQMLRDNRNGYFTETGTSTSLRELQAHSRGVAISSRRGISIVGWCRETDSPLIGWGKFSTLYNRCVTSPVLIVRSDGLFRFWDRWDRELAFKSINPTFLNWTWGGRTRKYHGLYVRGLPKTQREDSPWLPNKPAAIYPVGMFSSHVWYRTGKRDGLDVIEVAKLFDNNLAQAGIHLESQRTSFAQQYERCVNYSLKGRGIVFANVTQRNFSEETRKQLAQSVTKFSTERTRT